MGVAVLIVDDHPVMAESLAGGVASQDDLRLVGTAKSGSEAVAIAATRRVDVAIVDTELGGEDGVDVGRWLRVVSPGVEVVHLCGPEDDIGRVIDAMQDGRVRGWVTKNESMSTLLDAVRGAQRQETRVPPSLLTEVLARLVSNRPGPLSVLTSRQLQILQGLVDGLTPAAIAARLPVSTSTVRTHIRELTRRLGAHSALEAVAIAREAGLRAQSEPSGTARHDLSDYARVPAAAVVRLPTWAGTSAGNR